jgi:hypothetical protein
MVEKISNACVVCNEPITEDNDSKEHVITEAIGGRLQTKGFICRECNNKAGRTWDAKLASQLHPLSLMFDILRQRGSTPSLPIVTTAGEKLTIMPGGGFTPTAPSFSEEPTSSGAKIQISARSMKEAKIMLAGLQRKYPSINVDQLLTDAQIVDEYPKGMVHHQFEFGGEVSGRSIVKSALAMAHISGIPASACGDALSYLRDMSAKPCFGYYYSEDLVIERPREVPLHCVAVSADPDTGLILGYAEYFGVQRVVICLGRNYTGERLSGNYAIDPRSAERINMSVRLDFQETDIEDIYSYKMIPDGAIAAAFANVVPANMERQFEAERNRVAKAAVEYAFENCGAKSGEILREEQLRKLSGLIAEKMTPFFLHNMSRSREIHEPPIQNESGVDE